jgi:hypothetical protein
MAITIYRNKKLETTEYGYLLETVYTVTLRTWFRRGLIWFDKTTNYTILNA